MPRKKRTKTQRLIDEAFHEVIGSPPSAVKQTRRTKGKKAARKMQTAIALEKARRRGVRVPRR